MDGAIAGLILVGVLVMFAAIIVAKSVALIPQAQAAVIERLGRYNKTVSGRLRLLVPFLDRIRARIDLREQVVSFPPQPVITEDNLTVNIDTVVYFQVTDPRAAVYEIANYIVGVEQLTTTTLRNVVGGMSLEQTLTSRDAINGQLRGVLDEATGKWGIRVARVELKAIDPPPSIQESMEKQMQADREKRAMILTAEGQRESAIKQRRGPEAGADPHRRGRQAGRDPGRRGRAAVPHPAGPGRAGRAVPAGAGPGQGDREGVRRDQGRQADAGAAGLPVPADAAADGAGRRQQGLDGAERLRQGAARASPGCSARPGDDGVFRYEPSPVEETCPSRRTTPTRWPSGSTRRPIRRSLRPSPRPRPTRVPLRGSVQSRPHRRIRFRRCSTRRCHSSGRTVRRSRRVVTRLAAYPSRRWWRG